MHKHKNVTLKCFFVFLFLKKRDTILLIFTYAREKQRESDCIIQSVTKQKFLKYIDKKNIRTVNNRTVSFERQTSYNVVSVPLFLQR